jgi:DNA polymerase III gamma/tau subunit
MSELHRKYRPKEFAEVLGQGGIISSLKAILHESTSHAFLFVGPSGVGKTTLARILANKVGCEPQNLLEIDAATHTGIDAMREVSEGTYYRGMGGSAVKVVIIDEAHALSKPAWQSLLKCVEEPPNHVYWVFCTTESGKIPKTIETRCACFQLNLVCADDLVKLLSDIVGQEGYGTPEEVLAVIARQAFGSPRRAITYLAQCYKCTTAKKALAVLRRASEDDGEAVELARAIVGGQLTWARAMGILQPLKDQSPESIRLVILAYLTAVAFGSKSDQKAGRCLELMDCFSESYNASEGFAPLLLSLGRVVFGG